MRRRTSAQSSTEALKILPTEGGIGVGNSAGIQEETGRSYRHEHLNFVENDVAVDIFFFICVPFLLCVA